MAKYSQHVIEDIKSRIRLSEVIGSYVSLNRQGRSDDYKACCPFHSEKTPSFFVHDSNGFYKCFGCGKSGTVFTFLMEMEHITFPQAVEMLAEKAGIELKEESRAEKELHNKKDTIQDLYNRMCSSYHYILLNNPEAEKAREYIEKRGISEDTVNKFMLGYAFDSTGWLYGFLKNKNFSDSLMKDSGLFSKNYPTYPLFRNRVLFPVRTWKGDCVAFSGRDMSAESKAKYVNSPETVIYSKRHVLFGFYESLKTLKEKGEVIICEGNFDVISLHQAGITNAVAPLGTALTAEQIALIKRYCAKVFLLFDSDEAGRTATTKAILLCQKNNVECLVIEPFKTAKDASEVLQKEGSEALKNYVEKTVTALDYLVKNALKRYDIRTPKGKLEVLKEVSPFLDVTSSQIERQGYIKSIGEALKVREEEVLTDYKNNSAYLKKPNSENNTEPESGIKDNVKLTAELNALLLILKYRQYFNYFKSQIKITELEDPNAIYIYTVLEDSARDTNVSVETLLSTMENSALRNVIFGYLEEKETMTNTDVLVSSSVRSLKLKTLLKKRDRINSLINSLSNFEADAEEESRLLESKLYLEKEIEELKKEED